jgi:hypothetical protein
VTITGPVLRILPPGKEIGVAIPGEFSRAPEAASGTFSASHWTEDE